MRTLNYFEYSSEAFALTDFLSRDECHSLIQRAENQGFDDAPINTSSGEIVTSDVRNNARVLADDPELAEALWERCKGYVAATLGGWTAIGLNERFRFYRYDQYQVFRWHSDGRFARNEREESRYTFMIYLNDDYEGGHTDFRSFKVYPTQGMALCFHHPLSHEGAIVSRGRKYVLRTDVMYRAAD